MVLTDAQWAALAPLVERCRPRRKTPHRDLRRTVEAILWRHRNGAKWRSIPAELGLLGSRQRLPPCGTDDRRCRSWRMAAQTLRSEEHTAELQSRKYLVCRLLLEKKKQQR